MWYQAQDVVNHYRQNDQAIGELIQEYTQLDQKTAQIRQQVDQEKEAAALNLAQAYIPTFTQAALANAEQLTGFKGFQRQNPWLAIEHERKVLEKTIASILADERYQKRQALVGEHGTYTLQLQECQSFFDHWQSKCDPFEKQEGFTELLETKYDTPEFSVSWMSKRYWKLWAAGDRICAALKMSDFGDDVLPAYQACAAERDKWQEQVRLHEAKIAQIHQLVETHDTSQARVSRLEEIYLADCQQQLKDFLLLADLPLLEQWQQRDAPADRGIQMGLRKLAGLAAKADFTSQMEKELDVQLIPALQARQAKYQRKISKYGHPKRSALSFTEKDLDQGFLPKVPKFKQQKEKVWRALDQIEKYETYESFSLQNNPNLWWQEMTGRRPYSRFTPRLHAWYSQNEYVIVHDDDYLQDASLAAGASRQTEEDLDYLS